MSKAMLIIDKPIRCEDCPCSYYGLSSDEVMCKITENLVDIEQPIPKNCPFIELDMSMMDSILKAIKYPEPARITPLTYMQGHR